MLEHVTQSQLLRKMGIGQEKHCHLTSHHLEVLRQFISLKPNLGFFLYKMRVCVSADI